VCIAAQDSSVQTLPWREGGGSYIFQRRCARRYGNVQTGVHPSRLLPKPSPLLFSGGVVKVHRQPPITWSAAQLIMLRDLDKNMTSTRTRAPYAADHTPAVSITCPALRASPDISPDISPDARVTIPATPCNTLRTDPVTPPLELRSSPCTHSCEHTAVNRRPSRQYLGSKRAASTHIHRASLPHAPTLHDPAAAKPNPCPP